MRGPAHELAEHQASSVYTCAGVPASLCHTHAQPANAYGQDTASIVRLHSKKEACTPYMCFDEAYFKTLESMQWNRDNGCVELIPIVVGLP